MVHIISPELRDVITEGHAGFLEIRTPERTMEWLEKVLQYPGTALFELRDPGPVGFAWCEATDEGDFFIHHLYARRGGQRLIAAIETEARRRGCQRITTVTARRYGWVRAAMRKYGGEIAGYMLAKNL